MDSTDRALPVPLLAEDINQRIVSNQVWLESLLQHVGVDVESEVELVRFHANSHQRTICVNIAVYPPLLHFLYQVQCTVQLEQGTALRYHCRVRV